MRRVAALAVILLALGGFFAWRMTRDHGADGAPFLGYVEGEVLYIGPNRGRAAARASRSRRASVVKPGDPLFTMSTTLLDRQRAEASARIGQMEAQLAKSARGDEPARADRGSAGGV